MSQVFTVFQPGPSFSCLNERRAWVRYPCDLDSSCRPVINAVNRRWPAKVRNVSSGGMCVALDRRFEVGSLLTIDVQNAVGASCLSCVVKVIHVTREDCGNWLLGCSFRSPLSEDEVQELL